MRESFPVFIGYDSNEANAFEVCRASLLAHATVPLHIQPLDIRALRHAGMFTRAWFFDNGQFIDLLDGRPFSTEFSFTRFLVPSLCQHKRWALYCDSDFLWRDDVKHLLDDRYFEDAISVVKHDHQPTETTKMRGQAQARYYRKNWSSLMLFNNAHPDTNRLTPQVVSRETGQWLHGLSWTDKIGSIPVAWNWLAGISDPTTIPSAVHFTLGTPDMPGHENQDYADEWRAVLAGLV